MRLGSVKHRSPKRRTPHVFCVRNGLKVFWIDATRCSALVIQFQTIRDRADKRLIAKTMRPLPAETPVSVFLDVPLP
jgi:hypothetical protein